MILQSAALSTPRLARPNSSAPSTTSAADAAPFFIPEIDPYSHGFNVSSLIAHWAKLQPSVIALARPGREGRNGHTQYTTVTFAKLDERCSRAAHILAREGLRPGDRVGMFVTDGVDFVTFVYALQRLGAVPVLIDPGMGAKNAVKCIAEQKLTGFIGVLKAQVLRAVFRSAFKTVKSVVLTGPGRFPGAKRMTDLVDDLPRDLRGAPFPAFAADANAPATIVYTSGSTGVPKGVIYTHRMMAAQVNGVARVGNFKAGETHVACFPGFALYAVGTGMRTVFPRMDFTKPKKASPARIIDAIDAFEATTVFGSPALWETFSHAVKADHIELPRVRALFSSGAAVQPALLERILPSVPNGDFFTPYGATEALPIATVSGREVLERHAASTHDGKGTCVGRIADGTDVRIIAVTDAPITSFTADIELDDGDIGEICVCGPQVTEAYDQRDDANKAAKMTDVKGRVWHRVGDLGYKDGEGNLWFVGRMSHRVENDDGVLYSVPVEAVFERHDDVARAALSWVGKRPKQTPVVFLEFKPGIKGDKARVQSVVDNARQHALGKRVHHVFAHDGFPVDKRHNAKIEREKLAVEAQSLVKSLLK